MNSDIMVRDYISIARPNHWFKNVFMIPGAILGLLTSPSENVFIGLCWFILGFISTCIISSSNYTINELLDAPEDRKHPIKKQRPVAQGKIKYSIAVIQWFILIILGLTIAWKIGKSFFLIQVLFIVMALLYNLKPIRLKDKPFLDVISESVNNPIRFLLGWYAVQCQLIPPISMIFSYWMLGAFFMAIKRFAELRYIANSQMASSYRKSF
ncbi:UbiA family prenyltransferase, partial [bacterium]|nr:UbiA family prenyltransferase [bacterium]